MAKTRDSAFKRVKRAVEGSKSFPFGNLARGLAPFLSDEQESEPDWTNPAFRPIAADIALTVPAEPILRAFKAFHLDPANPFHWRHLLDIFARAHFGNPKKRGPKEIKWNSAAWCRLLADFQEVKEKGLKQNKPELSERAMCGIVARLPYYKGLKAGKGLKAETLRRQLISARDIKQNKQLRFVYKAIRSKLETDFLDRDEAYEDDRLSAAAYKIALDWVSNRANWRDI